MTAATPASRRWVPLAAFLYGTIAALLAALLFYRRQGVVDTSLVDLNGFGAIARNLTHGLGFSQGYGPTMRRAPLYPILGAGLLELFGSDGRGMPQALVYRPIIIANCLIFGITCVVVWSLGRRLFGSRAALIAVALCPLVPQSMRYVGMTEVETLMGLLIALLAVSGLALATRPGIRSGAAFGATAAAAVLTKPVALLYPFIFLAVATWRWRRTHTNPRSAFVGAAVGLALFGALLLPWTLRNMAVSGGQFKGVSSNGPGEFLRGYVNVQPKYYLLRQNFGGSGPGEKWDPEANDFEERILKPYGVPFYRVGHYASGDAYFIPAPPDGTSSASLEVEKDRVESALVKEKVLHDPVGFARKFCIQILTFWYVVETRTKSLFVGAIAVAVLALALVGVLRARRAGIVVWPVVAVLVYFNAVYAVFLAFARYSMPLYPTLIVLAAGGIAALSERFGRLPSRQGPSTATDP